MENKNYLMVEENIVTNIVIWNGSVNSWQPPQDAIMLVKETTPTKVWGLNQNETEYVLSDSVGDADIGFTWDGSFAITNLDKPVVPVKPETPVESSQE